MKWIFKNWLLPSIFLAIIIFFIVFKCHEGEFDLFKFPFNANVWGNAADWSMVIVTIITAVYLINTFKEQKKLSEIEQKRFEFSIMPVFKLVFDKNHSQYELSLINNPAKNVVIIYNSEKLDDETMAIWHEYHHPINFNVPNFSAGKTKKIIMTIEFDNILNKRYKQRIVHIESLLFVDFAEAI